MGGRLVRRYLENFSMAQLSQWVEVTWVQSRIHDLLCFPQLVVHFPYLALFVRSNQILRMF